jgi:hypothetical protein
VSSVTERRTFLGTLAGGLLAAPLAVEAQTPRAVPNGTGSPWLVAALPFFPFLLVAGVVFLLSTGFLVFVSSRRRRRKLVKRLVTLVAGSVCGAFWILLIDTAVNPAIPDAMHEPAVLVIGMVTALVAASLLWMANHLSEMVGLSAMAMGFHSLALPIAALISIVAGGAHAVDVRAVALSIGGLLLGVCLVFVGDRRRRRRSRSQARFDLGQPSA